MRWNEFWQEFVYQRMKTTDSWKNALISHGRGFPVCCCVYTHEKQHVSGASGKRGMWFRKQTPNLTVAVDFWSTYQGASVSSLDWSASITVRVGWKGSPTLQFQCLTGFAERHLVCKWNLNCLKSLGTESIASTLDSFLHLFATFRCSCLICGELSIHFHMSFQSCNKTESVLTCYLMGKSTVDFKMSMGPLFPF